MNILFSCDREKENKDNFLRELNQIFSNVKYIENYIPDKSERTIFFKLIRGLRKKTYKNKIVNRVYNNICRKFYLKKIESYNCKFDYFLTVSKEFSSEFLNDLKEKNPKIKTILYLWDKLEYTSHKNSYKYYDYVFTFDKGDAKEYNFIFRPTFFLDYFRENLKPYKEREYDLYYIGQIREMKRIEIIQKFYKFLKDKKMNIFIKLFKDRKNKKIEIAKDILLEEKIEYKENINKMKNSKVTLDISYKNQRGLTLRCFEALATETKIITDNPDIKSYDFYNPKNIFYLEKIDDIVNISDDFFLDEYQKVNEDIIEKYSVKGFLNYIFTYIESQ